MPRLSRLVLKGYKSIQKMDLILKQLNVFIGPNGAGKSNLISFFKMLNAIANQQLKRFTGLHGSADSFLYYGRKRTDQISAKLDFGNNGGYWFSLTPTQENRFLFSEEQLYFHDHKNYPDPLFKSLGSGHQEAELSTTNERMAYHILPAIQSWKVYQFHDTSSTAKVKSIGSIHDHSYLREDGSNLAAFLYKLKLRHSKQYQGICKTIRRVAPFFGDFILEPSLEDPESIQLKWHERNQDFPFTVHHLSDGTLRFICLVTVLLQPNPPTSIIIDEPELGLHPFAINILGGLIRSVSKKSQIILSTQSVTLLDQFSPNDVIVTERKEEATTFKRLQEEKLAHWLEEYSLSELWEQNYIQGRP